MAIEKVPHPTNFVHLEHEMLALWRDTNAFEKLREQNAGKTPWSFLDGPITANNPMGVHHAWGRAYKDAFQRYFAMNGRDQRYQNGFDCQGLWVEVEVEKEFGFATKRDIEEFGIDKFVDACKARVDKFARIQTEQSKRLGYWMDWDRDDDWDKAPGDRRSYYTLADENNYCIWQFLKKCHERGFIYRGTDVMPWSGKAGCAYSHMEIAEGRQLDVHTSVFVRFPIRGRDNEYLFVWTTTPWTLASNVGCAVASDLEYAKLRAKKDGALYYVAVENLKYRRLERQFKEGFGSGWPWPKGTPKLKTIDQIFKEQGGYTLEGTVLGAELVGLTYDGPFDDLPACQSKGGFPTELMPDDERGWPSAKDAHRVIDPGRDSKGAPYVIAGEGTGIVHTAPGSGDVDHQWGRDHKLVSIAPLDEEGRYLDGFGWLSGKRAIADETADEIVAELDKRGFLVATERYPHIYPHCWRTGDPLVFRLVDEWFISMDWRDEIKDVAKQVQWLPNEMNGLKRELDWLGQMRDWMISKKRYWGLALPIWVCESCKHFDVIGSREELQERAVEGWTEFDGHTPHRPWIDAVKLACPKCKKGVMARVPDVGNPWLDAGIVTYSTTRYRADREYWRKWIPADLVTECFPGQFRNWFYAMLAMSTMMEHVPPFKNLLGHALVLDENGAVMHKSDGTAIWFEEAAEQIGVDTMRWMYCAHPPTSDLRFGLRHKEEHVTVERPDGTTIDRTVEGAPLCKVTSTPADELRNRVILTLWNSYRFFADLAAIENAGRGFDPNAKGRTQPSKRSELDRWILSEVQLLIAHMRERIEAYDLGSACKRAERFIDNLSNWYIRRSRRRFYVADDASKAQLRDKRCAFDTLYEVLTTLSRTLAPIIPFITEAIHQNLDRGVDDKAPVSVHLASYPTALEELIDKDLSSEVDTIIRLVSLGRAARNQVKLGVRQPLAEITVLPADKVDRDAARKLAREIEQELNVKLVTVLEPGDRGPIRATVKPNLKALGPKLGAKMKLVTAALASEDPDAIASAVRAGKTVALTIEGGDVTLSPDDILLGSDAPDHVSVAADARSTVALDTRITPELAAEGLARELIRHVATLRKQLDLAIEQRIALRYETCDVELQGAITTHAATIKDEVLALELASGLDESGAHELKLKGREIRIQITEA